MLKNTVDIITLGCSKNLVDSEKLMRTFAAAGWIARHDSAKVGGEIVVVNTCGFIDDAKEESINTILGFIEQKKRRKIGKLFVMGCLSERYKNELEKELPEVDRFYGKFDWKKIIEDIGVANNVRARLIDPLQMRVTPLHYSYIKISEGCNRTCSYCAIPIMTGKHVSRRIDDILQEIALLAQNGTKEFNLIAQDLTYYGLDIYKKNTLAELVEKIAKIQGVEWVRLHYGYPQNFPFDLLKVIRETPNVCNYLDMALQHISDNMLKSMRRNISKSATYDLIHKICTEIPDIHLRTTLLLGHPNETLSDVEELKNFVREMRFERLGAFAYSHEEGTFAHKNYADIIPVEEKNRRVGEIMDIQQKISAEINAQKIGKMLKTIIDRKENDYFIGRTEFDSPEIDGEVLISTKKTLKIGEFYNVKITGAQEFDLEGEI
ncbi:MAG: 30S ribosomal protein S12 methylthiotransferase RimO [Prevotellaceae bacterium]|jgi:ribosomal protein S12 methylthiotransferase|nr:30S ribosomal protein S12 methylthiotransferase RimO [Prevotellaceae bacterium]